MSFIGRLFKKKEPSPPEDDDDAALRLLKEQGADLTKVTETNFMLYFPTQKNAKSASRVAEREGYRAEIHDPPGDDGDWLLMLTFDLAPNRDAIKERRARLEALCDELDGEYNGWQAELAR